MGGMFSVIKVRKDQKPGDYGDPGWYAAPAGTVARPVAAPAGAPIAPARSLPPLPPRNRCASASPMDTDIRGIELRRPHIHEFR